MSEFIGPPVACVVCGQMSQGMYGPENGNHPQSVPCCQKCFDSGEIEVWTNKALTFIREQPHCIHEPGAKPKNLHELVRMYEHEATVQARYADGVCPNGCARMVRYEPGDDYIARCPSCGFVGHANTPFVFVEDEPSI